MVSEKQVAVDAVLKAAQLCQQVQADMVRTDSLEKADRSPVTVADFGSQALICKAIGDAFPEDVIVAEEDSQTLRTHPPLLERVTAYVSRFTEDIPNRTICDWIDRGRGEIPPQSPLFKGGRPLGTGFSGEVNLMSLAIFILYEIGLGVIIAFVANLIFIGVQMAGHIVDQQIGFSIANTIDLSFHAEVSLMASFQSLLALILFLSVDGHHLLLQGIRSSFELIPLGGARYEVPLLSYVAGLFNSIFVIALKVSSPVIMTIFLTNISLGMLARVMPQMNIFMVGFPLQIAVGLLTLAASIQVFGYLLINELDKLKTEISIVLNHFH